MVTDYWDDVWTREDERVRIYPDDDAEAPRDATDNLTVIAATGWCGLAGDRDPRADEVRWIVERHDWPVAEAAIRERFGATVVLPLRESSGALHVQGATDDGAMVPAVIFDTAKDRENLGVPDDAVRDTVLAELHDYNLWASGEGTWVIVRETRCIWERTDDRSIIKEEWVVSESVHGVVAEEREAVAIAFDYFPEPER
jgi:hypothetical protein